MKKLSIKDLFEIFSEEYKYITFDGNDNILLWEEKPFWRISYARDYAGTFQITGGAWVDDEGSKLTDEARKVEYGSWPIKFDFEFPRNNNTEEDIWYRGDYES